MRMLFPILSHLDRLQLRSSETAASRQHILFVQDKPDLIEIFFFMYFFTFHLSSREFKLFPQNSLPLKSWHDAEELAE